MPLTRFLGGYYSVDISPSVVMLALNTIFYYPPNHQAVHTSDPSGQFDWMEKELKAARKKNKKVGGNAVM